jgi:uncharacterized protein (DUF2236 family)
MTDDDLLAGFEACTLEEFHHADHVRVAWIILRRMPFPDALPHFIASLQRFAAAAGAPQKYDDALTRRYMALIDERMGGERSWAEFAAANPDLLVWVRASERTTAA